ncbi:hypothetical protein ANCCEY_04758 [Ancylostoma ceylanicum]|uniref:RSE1/DDB1/CPSF1 C-terminal domain-containing protein n=1 Tax=Ancylostoma ceylanicum TaxID=53326 RepID=A0A0D6M8F8_9BILA|nr:hypothetical protein ANCCEY_04758 [Ancylostoma ceylanicum]
MTIRYFQLRLPENVNEDIQEDPTALRSLWDRGLLNGASQKVDQVAVFYTGDLITSLQKTSLVPGANECVIYTTIGGAIGILVPFISKDALARGTELFQMLKWEQPLSSFRKKL